MNKPDVWRLLDVEIEEAIGRRTRRDENRTDSAIDPWDSEAATDRERFLGRPKVVRAKGNVGVVLALVGVVLAVLDGWIAQKSGLAAFAVAAAGFLALAGGLLALQPKALRGVGGRLRTLVLAKNPSLADKSPANLWDSLVGLVFWVPLATLIVLLAELAAPKPVLWLGLFAAVAFAGWRLLQALAAERIDERVKSGGERALLETGAPSLSAPAPVARTAEAAEAVATGADARAAAVQLEIITADVIPPASAESRARIAAVRMRAPAIRRVYRTGVAGLAIVTTLLALAYWLAGPAPLTFSSGSVHFSDRAPWFVAGTLAASLVLVSRRAQPWLRGALTAAILAGVTGGEAKVSPQEVDESEASIRPLALRLLKTFWVAVALVRAATIYPSLAAPWPLVFNAIAIASVCAGLYWIRRGAAAIERKCPYQPPLNLLALRVFGSAGLGDFLNLSNGWQWIGARQLLDGPNTAGHKARDLLNYLAGRTDRSIVEDDAELHKALAAFSTRPDRRLRFPVNSMQCGDATWKAALQSLLDQADVVVMDLSGLSEQNRGVAYELGKLVNEVPFNLETAVGRPNMQVRS